MKRWGITIAVGGASVLLFSVPSWSDEDEGKAADMVKAAKVTIDQAIKTASEKVPGTVIEAELEKKHDKIVWEVEVVAADGKVSEFIEKPQIGEGWINGGFFVFRRESSDRSNLGSSSSRETTSGASTRRASSNNS